MTPIGKDLYVKSISPTASEEDLRKLFSVCGKVTYIYMVMDSKTGVFTGCAYVKMSSEAEAKDAIITLDDALLIDRSIKVSAARPRPGHGRGRPSKSH